MLRGTLCTKCDQMKNKKKNVPNAIVQSLTETTERQKNRYGKHHPEKIVKCYGVWLNLFDNVRGFLPDF